MTRRTELTLCWRLLSSAAALVVERDEEALGAEDEGEVDAEIDGDGELRPRCAAATRRENSALRSVEPSSAAPAPRPPLAGRTASMAARRAQAGSDYLAG